MKLFALLLLLCASGPAAGQINILVGDRGSNRIWRFTDVNNNGIIENPAEVFPWFEACNAEGTIGIENPNALFIRSDGLVAAGDQPLHQWYFFQDLNNDGDAKDMGESRVVTGLGNASGVSTYFPTGGAFDSMGRLLIVNAGSASGPDSVHRCVDLNANNNFYDPGEMTDFITTPVFGPDNGPYGPWEMVMTPGDIGYLRNSIAGLYGVFRFSDSSPVNGRADDQGEFTPYWTLAASGFTPLSGFAIEPDKSRPGSLYVQQTAPGSNDQLIRITDNNGDLDANDPGEAVLVFSTVEANFISIDILCLPNGDVLMSDNSGLRIIRLHDEDGDGLFTSQGERTDIFVSNGSWVNEVRQLVLLPNLPDPPQCGSADFNGDGDTGTDLDIEAFFAALGGDRCCTCGSADFDADGDTGTDLDIEAFFRVLAGASC